MKQQLHYKVTIRLAEPKDKYDIVKIQFYALKVLAAKDYNSEQLNALLRSKSTPRQSWETIFVAEIEQKVVGFASLLYPFNTIGAVFVDPLFVRRNIGTQLIERLEEEAIAYKVPVLWVYSSLTGYSFYQANGYQTIKKTTLPLYSTYIPCVRMKKRLLPVSKSEIFYEISQLLAVTILTAGAISFFSIMINILF